MSVALGYFTCSRRDGTAKRPKVLITAGITAPRASLSVQQCNHQPSTYNAQEGRREAEGAVQVDAEQMDNVSSAIVLQVYKSLRLKLADRGICF